MVKTKKTKRESLSKKIRFEVFKRDKFTCVYCGRKAPDVILEVDHIEPVAKGGDNSITNLVTSCIDCNRGKRDIPLSVNETLEKQRIQLELLQEKREQLEMLFKWKKSLDELDEYESDLFIQYIEDKIQPYTLKKHFKTEILKLFEKYKQNEILDAINVAAKKYLKYDYEDKLEQDSVEEFLNKIGGVLVNKNLLPIKQKLAYIKGICRNRFGYWDNAKGSIILNNYVKALTDYGWSEDKILEDLEKEVIPIAKEAKHLTEWRNTIEGWTNSVNSWDKNELSVENLSNEELEATVNGSYSEICFYFEFIKHAVHIFDEDDENSAIKQTIAAISKYSEMQLEKLSNNEDLCELKPEYLLFRKIGLFNFIKNIDNGLKYAFSDAIEAYTKKIFYNELYYTNRNLTADNFCSFLATLNSKLDEYMNNLK